MIDAYGRVMPDYGMRPNYTNMYGMGMPQHQEVVKVSGRNGADAYQLAPNSSALLLDTTDSIVWLKTTDGAGYPTCTPYTITPYQPQPDINMQDLVARIEKLEGKVNGKSYVTDAESDKSNSSK